MNFIFSPHLAHSNIVSIYSLFTLTKGSLSIGNQQGASLLSVNRLYLSYSTDCELVQYNDIARTYCAYMCLLADDSVKRDEISSEQANMRDTSARNSLRCRKVDVVPRNQAWHGAHVSHR